MLTVSHNSPLLPLNTMGIEGTVKTLVEWETCADLERLFTDPEYAAITDCRVKAVGQGSNLLFKSGHFDGTLLKCTGRGIETVSLDGDSVTVAVQAGCPLDDFVAEMCSRALWGVENLSLIPGTTGGATVQNVGAYGTEFGNCVVEAECFDRLEKKAVMLTHDMLHYGYRDSLLKHEPASGRYIVTRTLVRLTKARKPTLTYGNLHKVFETRLDSIEPGDVRNEIIGIRNGKLPEVGKTGSAGSFFKNPVVTPQCYDKVVEAAGRMGIDTTAMPAHKVLTAGGEQGIKLSAAWLIDKSGWKGFSRGNVGTWHCQPLVLVNATGNATGAEIEELASDIIADVRSKWGITLEPEVEFV